MRPANGDPIIVPTQDVVLGLYYMTRESLAAKGAGMVFCDVNEVHRAQQTGAVSLHAPCRVRLSDSEFGEDGKLVHRTRVVATTVGRALLSTVLPEGMPFDAINCVLDKKAIVRLIDSCYRTVGLKDSVIFADRLMYTGFHHATRSGVSIGVDDMVVPDEKSRIIGEAEAVVKEIQQQ